MSTLQICPKCKGFSLEWDRGFWHCLDRSCGYVHREACTYPPCNKIATPESTLCWEHSRMAKFIDWHGETKEAT